MTNAELNRDVKRLARFVRTKQTQELFETNQAKYYEQEQYINKEIKRLYYADDTFEVLNKQSILTLLRLNLRYRPIPLHCFGIKLTRKHTTNFRPPITVVFLLLQSR